MGYLFIVLAVFGLVLDVVAAIRDNQPFYGRNVYGLPLGSYATLAVLLLAASIGLIWLVRKIRDRPPDR